MRAYECGQLLTYSGRFLVEKIAGSDSLELAFVWNRSSEKLREAGLDQEVILEDLDDFASRNADLIIEVAHPAICKAYGPRFLQHADFMIGSPTALAEPEVDLELRRAATRHGLYVPCGAFWGAQDICKMAHRGTLKGLKVSMTKHPSCFRLHDNLQRKLSQTERVVLYEGAVGALCPLAPNNVNTMAAAAIAAHNLGFQGVQAALIADPGMPDHHLVEVEVWGPGEPGEEFHVSTVRRNPANLGVVTGNATYNSFYSSMLGAVGFGPGVHIC